MIVYFKRLKPSGFVSLEAFKMYYAMRASAPSLHSYNNIIYIIIIYIESTDSLI